MLTGLTTRLLQHLIAQNSWACPLLQAHAGKCVAFKLGVFSRSLIILEDGSLAMAGDSHVADASVSLTPSLALRLLSGDEAAKRQVAITGDTQLAAELAKVLSAMRWDFEDDASKLVGDVAAHKIGQTLRSIATTGKETGSNLVAMLSEYWQEEMPLIAKKRHVDAFNSEVDTLRADLARFEKKFAKLQQQLTKQGAASGSQP